MPEGLCRIDPVYEDKARTARRRCYTRSTTIATALPPPRHSDASPRRRLCFCSA